MVYNQEKSTSWRILCQPIRETPEAINITGHSLGGALSQVITSFLLENKREFLEKNACDFSLLAQVKDIRVEVFQSAGVTKGLVEKVKKDAVAIHKQGTPFKIDMFAHIKSNDIVPVVSGDLIFSDVDKDIANVKLNLWGLDEFAKPIASKPTTKEASYFIGASLASGLNPVVVSTTLLSILSSRIIAGILNEHTSGFNFDEKKFPIFKPNTVYTNSNEQGKEKIKEIFEKYFMTELKENTDVGKMLFDLQKFLYSCLQKKVDNDNNYLRDTLENLRERMAISNVCLREFVINSPIWASNIYNMVSDSDKLFENLDSSKDALKKIGETLATIRSYYDSYTAAKESLEAPIETLKSFKNAEHNLLESK